MARKNRTAPHIPFKGLVQDQSKRRFATRRQAEAFAEERMLLVPNLELHVYKGLDGGWYLTRNRST